MIMIDTDEAPTGWFTLMAAVADQGETVIICRGGKPVAEIRGTAVGSDDAPNPLQMHPELAGKILYDPTEPATEDEWPSEFR